MCPLPFNKNRSERSLPWLEISPHEYAFLKQKILFRDENLKIEIRELMLTKIWYQKWILRLVSPYFFHGPNPRGHPHLGRERGILDQNVNWGWWSLDRILNQNPPFSPQWELIPWVGVIIFC